MTDDEKVAKIQAKQAAEEKYLPIVRKKHPDASPVVQYAIARFYEALERLAKE